jgi:lipoprotein-anchoring transpeptidase ErfK/SrfK
MLDMSTVRPRYGRIAVLGVSMSLTLGAAVASALGFTPSSTPAVAAGVSQQEPSGGAGAPAVEPSEAVDPSGIVEGAGEGRVPVPPSSGEGRRVVFDMSDQRVWLVGRRGHAFRTYLVSGSKHDNLHAGTYEVYSRSLHATGYTGATTMDYMVRFTTGDNAAIGFHDIPVDAQGAPVQGLDELGTATSAGCIRQRTADARVLWRFAQEGTTVVVTD